MSEVLEEIHNILDRMKINHEKGKGVHISAYELKLLSITSIGAIWMDDRPAKNKMGHVTENTKLLRG